MGRIVKKRGGGKPKGGRGPKKVKEVVESDGSGSELEEEQSKYVYRRGAGFEDEEIESDDAFDDDDYEKYGNIGSRPQEEVSFFLIV